eukprot:1772857-Prorocentrum_lima.AAC.1
MEVLLGWERYQGRMTKDERRIICPIHQTSLTSVIYKAGQDILDANAYGEGLLSWMKFDTPRNILNIMK